MTSRQYKRVLVILADGTRPDVFDAELSAGNLPNISKHLIERGSSLKAVTAFPSTTGPAYLPYLTGCLPGTCNVPGIRWFDKKKNDGGYSFDRYRSYVGFESFCMANDMLPHVKTIFEIVPDSYSIFNPIARGTGWHRNRTSIMRIWYWYYGHQTDRWSFVDAAAIRKMCETLKFDPKFIFTVFPAIDEYSHFSHPKHDKVINQYRELDRYVEKLVDELTLRGQYEDTAIFIVSDHGLSQTHTHFCVNTFLERKGLPAFFYPRIFEKKGKLSANMVSGNGMTHVYFKNADGWGRPTTYEMLNQISVGIVDEFLRNEAVDILTCRSESGAEIFSRRGRASLSIDGKNINYKTSGGDPFGYGELPRIMTADEELSRTWQSEYPDALYQISRLLSSPRSGDMIISAKPGFDLRLKYEEPEHRSSHGSLHELHMRVPVISNVRFKERPVRTVDTFPTFLNLLGYPVPDYVDGTALELKT